jgi:hypothetical protein
MPSLLAKLKSLSPRDFENLAFDLVASTGMQNLRWRTPGSDGGRDLEGDLWSIDFAGDSRLQRWYIECKRYQAAIDWPTVYGKLAYAENHGAHYLLFITTSSFSPQCLDEVSRRNIRGSEPHIRCWAGHDLVPRLSLNSKIALKYALTDISETAYRSFFDLSLELAKITQAAYASHRLGSTSDALLEAGAAVAELITWRMKDLDISGHFMLQEFQLKADRYPWLITSDAVTIFPIDRSGLRAIMSVWRLLLRAETVHAKLRDGGTLELMSHGHRCRALPETSQKLLQELC